MVNVGETTCKGILNKSGIKGIDYAINPYIGCTHGCVYCYAKFMTRWYHQGEKWGTFVDAKVNAVNRLKEEAPKKKMGTVLLSSVTDPYQPIEKKYKLTRGILETLSEHSFPVEILTKSSLVTRDLDILTKIDECEVGLTLTSFDDTIRKVFEPNASSTQERIETLEALNDVGVDTYAFLGPLLPYLSDKTLEDLMNALADKVDRVLVDRLNIKAGNWGNIREAIEDNYPELLDKIKEATVNESPYYQRLGRRVRSLLEDRMIPADILF